MHHQVTKFSKHGHTVHDAAINREHGGDSQATYVFVVLISHHGPLKMASRHQGWLMLIMRT